MPRDEWTGSPEDLPPKIGGTEIGPLGVCPGYIARLPIVGECAAAWRAFDKGNFEAFHPDPLHVICEGVSVLADAIERHTADVLKPKNRPPPGGIE